tara:strand:- start:1238 stop:1855 length:618 start_codon:yes stop_codon:yes gene_type:complete
MAENLVSQPPLTTAISDNNGMLSKAWSIWFRDLYRRTSYKGGNAIDENKEETDGELLTLTSTLTDTIDQVNVNINGISVNSDNINVNVLAIQANTDNLESHELLEEAHGSNGVIVGLNDLADEATQGLVKRMSLLANAIASTASVAQADAGAAPATYSQAHSQSLVDLSNANKAAINILVTDLNNTVTVLNNLIARSKTSGQMTT